MHHGFRPENLVQNKPIGKTQRDPLPRLLEQLLKRAGAPAMIERAVSRPWASALFEGRRHVIALRLSGARLATRFCDFAEDIGSAEWSLPGHFVADIIIDNVRDEGTEFWLELSALTIEDW
ncbi:hypothetical protein EBBID32_28360 [Sphingobium indicum BiD32]|uniref:Uncharacterized protein n=2 Tax=Sphingobium indicum TaxID=332055 RepID=N1MSU2_9SPHN|nr:hypothetical protein EBBID32_28360 [Sphingobium indicum BiD32]